MNTALVLAGGVGSRMGIGSCPKQYLMLRGQPIVHYCLQTFQGHRQIDAIIIVAHETWTGFVDEWIQRGQINKFRGYAAPGETRQLSILNGLEKISALLPETENVLIHDAVRPLLPPELITSCLAGLEQAAGVMPVLPVRDTCYQSSDGVLVTGSVPRDQLFAGQSPEAFRFAPYLKLHKQMDRDKYMYLRGSSEIAYQGGLDVLITPGSERNFKITTKRDLVLAERYLDGEDWDESLRSESGRTAPI